MLPARRPRRKPRHVRRRRHGLGLEGPADAEQPRRRLPRQRVVLDLDGRSSSSSATSFAAAAAAREHHRQRQQKRHARLGEHGPLDLVPAPVPQHAGPNGVVRQPEARAVAPAAGEASLFRRREDDCCGAGAAVEEVSRAGLDADADLGAVLLLLLLLGRGCFLRLDGDLE